MIWIDGVLSANDLLPASDRGFLVGDGVFETILLINGRVIFEDEHRSRMRRGMDVLGMNGATPDFQTIALALGAGKFARAMLRCSVTRTGGRGLAPPPGSRLSIVASIGETPEDQGAPLTLAQSGRVRASRASTTTFKCIGAYAENILARMDALSVGADEALMKNERGVVVCASAANIYSIVDGRVLTPPVAEGAMPGCARAQVARICARLGIAFIEAIFGEAELAAPMFLSNSLVGVRRCVSGGEAQPSPVFDRIKASYDEEVARQGSIGS